MAHTPMVDQNLVKLYQDLTPEQCRELYLKQHDSINARTRSRLLAVIGAKTVYGSSYTPNYAEATCQK